MTVAAQAYGARCACLPPGGATVAGTTARAVCVGAPASQSAAGGDPGSTGGRCAGVAAIPQSRPRRSDPHPAKASAGRRSSFTAGSYLTWARECPETRDTPAARSAARPRIDSAERSGAARARHQCGHHV